MFLLLLLLHRYSSDVHLKEAGTGDYYDDDYYYSKFVPRSCSEPSKQDTTSTAAPLQGFWPGIDVKLIGILLRGDSFLGTPAACMLCLECAQGSVMKRVSCPAHEETQIGEPSPRVPKVPEYLCSRMWCV